MAIQVWRPRRMQRRRTPFSGFAEMQDWFDEMFNNPYFFPEMWQQSPLSEGNWVPLMDVIEEDGKVIVKADLPGMKKEDIDVSVSGSVLVIKGERQAEKEIKEENYRVCERSSGSFVRSITLPSAVDAEKIEATYEDGILQVSLPKKEVSQSKKVEIKAK